MTVTKPLTVFADSMQAVKERVQALQAEKKTRNEILVELNKLIHDVELFTKSQRANVVRELNKAFNMNVSMSEIKRAIKTVNTAKSDKATPVDGLSGKATLDLDLNGQHESVAAAAPASSPAAAPAATVEKNEPNFTLVDDTKPTTETNTTIQENNTMAPIKETLATVSERIAVGAPQTHAEKVETLKIILASAGATTEEARNELINGFIAANPSLAVTWNLMKAYPQGEFGVTGALVAYMEIDKENEAKFKAYLSPVDPAAPAAPVAPVADPAAVAAAAAAPAKPEVSVAVAVEAPGLKERVMTTIRGNRETGFSSGVVAAATAVVGGGLEMAFKGSATIGSGVGTVAGAVGAYFLGESTDKLMESETGRYLLAGAIGVVAGGLGSRIGRGVQDEYVNPSSEVTGALETLPGAPAPVTQPGGLVGNSEALLGMLGM